MIEVAVPEILIEDIILNSENPFKRTLHWNRLRCKLCNEIILKRTVTNEKDWEKVRKHLRSKHSIEVSEEIPVRLLSRHLFGRWLRQIRGEIKK